MSDDDKTEDLLRQRGWSIYSEGSAADLRRPLEQQQSTSLVSQQTAEDTHNPDIRMESSASQQDSVNNNTSNHNNSSRIQQLAKARLSKWAARLFDPDRPRVGLIQPPQTIPLNDEFLSAFGKREKEYDESMGKTLEIDHRIQDNDDDDKQEKLPAKTTTFNNKSKKHCKVKITNLKYTTTVSKLEQDCSIFGDVHECNLIMDDIDTTKNKGRAYVTFCHENGANGCLVGLTKVDGRKVTVTMAADSSSSSNTNAGVRYWSRDISTKCYRCGQVGHLESACTNEALAKPCPLCAGIGHELRECPIKAVCFNCGVPGHVSRACPRPRGMRPRRVCTICLASDHTMWQCRGLGRERRDHYYSAGMPSVICMTCGRNGHFMCAQMKWFFGLDGVSCFNCGRQGHLGIRCDRPNMDEVSRDEDLAEQEIHRATAEDLERSRQGRSRGRNDNSKNRNSYKRARSMPPERKQRFKGNNRR